MTADQTEISIKLGNCRFLPGSWDKRFARNVYDKAVSGKELTENQKEWIYRLLYSYRGQLPVLYQKHKGHPHCSRKQQNIGRNEGY